MSDGINGPLTDIALREIAELKAALAQARLTADGYRDLLITAAHEIRSPLHALSLHLELLVRLSARAGDPALDHQIQLAKRVLGGFARRAGVFLDVARVTAGVFALNAEPVMLSDAVACVLELYAAQADLQSASIRAELEAGLTGRWDRAAIETILANLVSNALKYGAGSPVTIDAKADGAGNAVIRVIDAGPGIDLHQRIRIFDKFTRAVQPNSAIVGYGLGLWIAQQLAGLHGGSIILAEAPPPGATFVVTLPLHNDAAPER